MKRNIVQDIFGLSNYDTSDFNYPSFIDYEDMSNTKKRELLSIRNIDLEKICVELSVKKTGKKSEKVSSILSGISNILDRVTWTTNIDIESGDDAMQYIFENGLHEITTFYLVRDMAYNPVKIWKDENGNTKELPYDCAGGCKILMKDLQDCIWDDVRQAVALAIIENPSIAYVKDGFCRLTSDGYRECKNAISRTFGKMRMRHNDKNEERLSTIVCSDNGEYEKIVTEGKKSDSAYITALSYNVPDYEALANNDFLVSFFRWLKSEKKYAKYYDSMFSVFCGKVEGMKNKDIIESKNVTRRIFDKCIVLLKEAYKEYGHKCYDTSISESVSYGCTYKKPVYGAENAYTFKYGSLTSGIDYSISFDRLAEMSEDRKSMEALKKRMKEEEENLLKKAQKDSMSMHVYYTKSGKKLTFVDGKAV